MSVVEVIDFLVAKLLKASQSIVFFGYDNISICFR